MSDQPWEYNSRSTFSQQGSSNKQQEDLCSVVLKNLQQRTMSSSSQSQPPSSFDWMQLLESYKEKNYGSSSKGSPSRSSVSSKGDKYYHKKSKDHYNSSSRDKNRSSSKECRHSHKKSNEHHFSPSYEDKNSKKFKNEYPETNWSTGYKEPMFPIVPPVSVPQMPFTNPMFDFNCPPDLFYQHQQPSYSQSSSNNTLSAAAVRLGSELHTVKQELETKKEECKKLETVNQNFITLVTKLNKSYVEEQEKRMKLEKESVKFETELTLLKAQLEQSNAQLQEKEKQVQEKERKLEECKKEMDDLRLTFQKEKEQHLKTVNDLKAILEKSKSTGNRIIAAENVKLEKRRFTWDYPFYKKFSKLWFLNRNYYKAMLNAVKIYYLRYFYDLEKEPPILEFSPSKRKFAAEQIVFWKRRINPPDHLLRGMLCEFLANCQILNAKETINVLNAEACFERAASAIQPLFEELWTQYKGSNDGKYSDADCTSANTKNKNVEKEDEAENPDLSEPKNQGSRTNRVINILEKAVGELSKVSVHSSQSQGHKATSIRNPHPDIKMSGISTAATSSNQLPQTSFPNSDYNPVFSGSNEVPPINNFPTGPSPDYSYPQPNFYPDYSEASVQNSWDVSYQQDSRSMNMQPWDQYQSAYFGDTDTEAMGRWQNNNAETMPSTRPALLQEPTNVTEGPMPENKPTSWQDYKANRPTLLWEVPPGSGQPGEAIFPDPDSYPGYS